jgi:hypothetical protein
MPAAPNKANSECEAVSEPRASRPSRARGDALRVSIAASEAIETTMVATVTAMAAVSGSGGKIRFTSATAVTSTTG